MTDDIDNDDKALYARFRVARDAAPPGGSAVDLTSVAAWIDRRLSEDEMERVEAGLLADPALLNTALYARTPAAPAAMVSEALLARLQNLVPCEAPDGVDADKATILLFAPRQRIAKPAMVRVWLSRAAIAASLLIVSAAGLGVGVTAAQNFSASAEPSHQDSVMELLNSGSVMSDDVG